MKLIQSTLFTAFLLFFAGSAAAVEFHDMQFPDKLKLKGSRTEIELNGIGYRSKFFFKIYIGALYTPERSSSPQLIAEQKGPKRILMHFLYEKVERDKIIEGWNDGFQNNTDPETLAALSDRIAQFNDFFPTLREGDVVSMDYVPRKGTRVMIKGNEMGVIKGKDFFDALLRIWLGDEPADEGLKESLLGID